MFRSLLEKFGGKSVTFTSWILSVLGIVGVRIFLEHYSSYQSAHYVLIDASTILHYTVFYIAILLICNTILLLCTRQPIQKVASMSLSFFPIIWLPPIVDLIVSGGKGFSMTYLFISKSDIMRAFFTEFWSTPLNGITPGIRFEVILIAVFFFATIYSLTKNKLRAAVGALAIYCTLFGIAAIPSILAILAGQSNTIIAFLASSIEHSRVLNNLIYPLVSTSQERFFDIGFNAIMTQIELLIALVAAGLFFFNGLPEKTLLVLKNFRPQKALFYLLLIVIGVLVGDPTGTFFLSWINILSLVLVLISFAFAWAASVCINDIYDLDIDVISNRQRPLPAGKMTKSDFYFVAHIFILIAGLCALASSAYSFFFVLLFLTMSYIYSAEPLRLRQYFPISNLIIGLAGVSALLSGFFLSHSDQSLVAFPPVGIICIVIVLAAVSMVKDIKDYAGDKANHIYTLPTLVGLPVAKTIIAICVTVGYLGLAIYLASPILIVTGILTSIATWKILFAKVYNELHFFLAYIIYLLVFIVLLVS